MSRLTKIIRTKAILVEGADAYYFTIWLLRDMAITDVQVFDFGGVQNNDLSNYFAMFKKLDSYHGINKILILRDAEASYQSAETSLVQVLARNDLFTGQSQFVFGSTRPYTAFAIFPLNSEAGTLEDLCLELVSTDPVMECVDQFMECARRVQGGVLQRPHKSKLYAFLSAKNDFAGLKLGEATKARAWDLNHPTLSTLRTLISSM